VTTHDFGDASSCSAQRSNARALTAHPPVASGLVRGQSSEWLEEKGWRFPRARTKQRVCPQRAALLASKRTSLRLTN
jgi:hypothetical protein